MTTTEQFREDAEFLREQSCNLLARMEGEEGEKPEYADVERLQHIANSLDIAATVMFTPSLVLEKRLEEILSNSVESALDEIKEGAVLNRAFVQDSLLWLIYQALKSGANKALLGQGLAGLGMGAAASLFGGLGKQLIDPEDK